MRSVCVTVTEGARVVVSGRAIRVDDSATLSSVVALVVGDPLVVSRVDRVQASNTISGTRFDATVEDEVGLQLEFERRYFFPLAHGDDVTASWRDPPRDVPVIMPPGRRISLKSTSQYCPYARPVRL